MQNIFWSQKINKLTLIRKRQPKGIGLLELMLALVVISLILFTVTRYFTVVNENLRVAQAEQIINNVVGASYKWLQGQTNFSTISMQNLSAAGLIPQSYLDPKANPWKNTIVVTPTPDNSGIYVLLSGMPQSSCKSLRDKLQKYAKFMVCMVYPNDTTFRGTF